MPQLERCLYPRRRPLLLLFFCLLWIVVTMTPSRHPGGAMYSFLFAACIIVFNAWIIPGAAWLKLDSRGFTVRYWFAENTYRWTDIKEFKLLTYRSLGFIPVRRSVCFSFSESYGKRNIVLRVASKIAQYDRNLPNSYGMKAKELLALLELCRRHAVEGVVADSQAPSSPATNRHQETTP